MKRTLLVAGLIGAAITVLASPVMATGIDGIGTVGTCTIVGRFKLKPAFTNTDRGPAIIKFKSRNFPGAPSPCPGASGDGQNLVAGKTKGIETIAHSDCTALIGTGTEVFTLTVKWKTKKGTPKLNPSTLTMTSETGSVTSDGHGSLDLAGSVTAGSFTGLNVTAHLEIDPLISDLLPLCVAKGFKKVPFGTSGTSTVTIN